MFPTLIITVPLKKTRSADVGAALYSAVLSVYDKDTAAVVPACRALTELRATALQASPDSPRDRRDCAVAYIRALVDVLGGDPVLLQHVDNINGSALFSWVDAFSKGVGQPVAVETQSFAFERMAWMFNVAAAECALAVLAQRGSSDEEPIESMKRSREHLCYAAGAYRYLHTECSPGQATVTPDMSQAGLVVLEECMLANAQALSYSIAVAESVSNTVCSRLAVGARDRCQAVAAHSISSVPHSTAMYAHIGRLAAVLSECWEAVSQRHAADAVDVVSNMGERLSRLRIATDAMTRARYLLAPLDTTHELTPVLVGQVDCIEADMTAARADVIRRNELIFDNVLELKTVPVIAGIKMAESLSFAELIAGDPDPRVLLLRQLVPTELSVAAERYQSLSRDVVECETQTVTIVSKLLRESLIRADACVSLLHMSSAVAPVGADFHVPDAVLKEESADRAAIDAVRAVQHKNGLRTLLDTFAEVERLAKDAEMRVSGIEFSLAKEAAEDADIQTLLAKCQRTRPTSEVLTAKYLSQIMQIRQSLRTAANLDSFVDASIKELSRAIRSLTDTDFSAALPRGVKQRQEASDLFKLSETEMAILVDELTRQTLDARALLEEKDTLIHDLEAKRAADDSEAAAGVDTSGRNPTDLVNRTYESLKFKVFAFRKQASACAESLEHTVLKLERFGRHSSGSGFKQSVNNEMSTVYKHLATANKHAELEDYLAQGTVFYIQECESMQSLKTDVEGFVFARTTEAADIRIAGEAFIRLLPAAQGNAPQQPSSTVQLYVNLACPATAIYHQEQPQPYYPHQFQQAQQSYFLEPQHPHFRRQNQYNPYPSSHMQELNTPLQQHDLPSQTVPSSLPQQEQQTPRDGEGPIPSHSSSRGGPGLSYWRRE
jgi:BRO1-like domain/ALIX V-shaped domain binding to HIV